MSAETLEKNELDSITTHCSKFREISEKISELAATVDIRITPYHNKELTFFSKLSTDTRINILNSLRIYLEVHQDVVNEGASILDSARVVWSALAKLGYRPTSDLFSYIKEGNVVEIHDHNLVQVFRNFVFFKYCSYTLEELYCFALSELYSRDQSVAMDLITEVQKVFSEETKTVTPVSLKPHIIYEIASIEKLQIQDQIHYFAPLFSTALGNRPAAIVTIESASINPIETITEVNNLYQFKQPGASSTEDFSL